MVKPLALSSNPPSLAPNSEEWAEKKEETEHPKSMEKKTLELDIDGSLKTEPEYFHTSLSKISR